MTSKPDPPTLEYRPPPASTGVPLWVRLQSFALVMQWLSVLGTLPCAALMLWAARLPVSNWIQTGIGLIFGATSLLLWIISVTLEVLVWKYTRWPARYRLLTIAPIVLGGICGLLAAGAPCRLMFQANKPAMDRWAQSFLSTSGPPPTQCNVGSYKAFDIEPIPGGVKFLVVGCGFFRSGGGFAYSTSGRPPGSPEETFTPIGGGWYIRTYDEP